MRIFIGLVWIIYVGYLLLSDFPPGESLLHITPATLEEVIDLSWNFWFVTPVFLSHTAPVLHPMLESIFNIVVAWGLLFWGFFIERRGQKLPMAPFLVGTAFLTNVFYLPWLALRNQATEMNDSPLTRMEKVTESPLIPVFLTIIFLVSILWGIFARPEFGDLSMRWHSFQTLIGEDRLAYSFAVDLIFFSLFQSWLVKDDMKRRHWDNNVMLWMTRLIPFFGLVIYFLYRPSVSSSWK